MRTIERTTQFKRDYKRELKGRYRAELDEMLLPVIAVSGRFYQPKKVSTSIRLDNDILLFFKKRAKEKHVPYQALINQYLRNCVQHVVGHPNTAS